MDKGSLKGLTEGDLTGMKFLKSDAKMIMGQLELMFAPFARVFISLAISSVVLLH